MRQQPSSPQVPARSNPPAPAPAHGRKRQATREDIEAIKAAIVAAKDEITTVLVSTVKIETFLKIAAMAIGKNPDLATFDHRSVIDELLKCASDGLVPDGREAVILPYWDDTRRVLVARYQPMYQGIIKRLRQLGETTSITACAVFEKDEFSVNTLDFSEKPVHRPFLSGPRGAIIAGCAIFRNGEEIKHVEVLDRYQIARIRSKAKSQKVWSEWEDEKVRISSIRRGSKYIALMDESRVLIERHDDFIDLDKKNFGEAKTATGTTERLASLGATAALIEPTQAEVEAFLNAPDERGLRRVVHDGDDPALHDSASQLPDEGVANYPIEGDDEPDPAALVVAFRASLDAAVTLVDAEGVRQTFRLRLAALRRSHPKLHADARQAWSERTMRLTDQQSTSAG